MGKLSSIQDLVAARIGTVGALAGVPVIIDRQQDLARMIEAALAKMKLCILLYAADSVRGANRRAGDPFLTRTIIEVYGMPLMQPATGALSQTVPDVAELVAGACDGYRPESDDHFWDEWAVNSLAMVPDTPGLLVWRVVVNCGEVPLF